MTIVVKIALRVMLYDMCFLYNSASRKTCPV